MSQIKIDESEVDFSQLPKGSVPSTAHGYYNEKTFKDDGFYLHITKEDSFLSSDEEEPMIVSEHKPYVANRRRAKPIVKEPVKREPLHVKASDGNERKRYKAFKRNQENFTKNQK